MGSELQISHIEEIAEAMGDAPFGSNLKNSHYTESGALVVQGKNVQGRSFDWSDKRHVSLEKWESLPRSRCKPGDLIFPKVGTIGKVGILNECEGYENYILSTNTMRLRVDQTKADPQFVYYFFTAPTTVNLIHALNSKSVQPVFNFTTLKAFQIELPPLPEQKAIAHILGTLDDKIELNRRMNATLEGMAQALFKSWFVDFDPVIDNALAAGNPIPDELAPRAEVRKKALGERSSSCVASQKDGAGAPSLPDFPAAFQFTEELGWIPEGWEPTTLSELLEVKYGKDHKKLANGKYPVYGSGGLMRHAESALYKGESVLIPRKGTLSNILYLNEEFWTVDTMFYTIPKMGAVAKFCYYHLKGLDFISMNVGSAVPSMTTKVLNNLPITKASDHVLEQFDALISAYFRKSEQNDQESQTLTKLRDTLLPKLISGDLRIPNNVKLRSA